MTALSEDLQWRIVHGVRDDKLSVLSAAARYAVAPATVVGLTKLYRETGDVKPRPIGGG